MTAIAKLEEIKDYCRNEHREVWIGYGVTEKAIVEKVNEVLDEILDIIGDDLV